MTNQRTHRRGPLAAATMLGAWAAWSAAAGFAPAEQTFVRLTTSGSGYERGLQQGHQLASVIRTVLEQGHGKSTLELARRPDALRRLLRSLKALPQGQELIDEMQGIAEGAGVPFARIAAFNLGFSVPGTACSIVLLPETADGPLLVNTNDDNPDYARRVRDPRVLRIDYPATGHAMAFHSLPGTVWAYRGVNQQGLAVGGASGRLRDPGRNPEGLLCSVALRYALQFLENTGQAVRFLETHREIGKPTNIALLDRVGEAAILESAPCALGVRRSRVRAPLFATNYFQTDAFPPFVEESAGAQNARDRYRRIGELLAPAGPRDLAFAQRLVRDTNEGRSGQLCQDNSVMRTLSADVCACRSATFYSYHARPADCQPERVVFDRSRKPSQGKPAPPNPEVIRLMSTDPGSNPRSPGGRKETLASSPGPYHDLVLNRRPVATIVLPEKAHDLETFAAAELRKYVKAITGAELPMLHEPQTPDTYGLWLGQTRAAAKGGDAPGKATLGRDGYTARVDSQGLLLAGRCPLGTLFGVYDLIEREFGVRWCEPDAYPLLDHATRRLHWHAGGKIVEELLGFNLAPARLHEVQGDRLGEVIPQAESLRIGTFRRQFKPSFDYRWVHEGDWALKQRMNIGVTAGGKPVGVNLKWHYHTFCELIPPREHFEKHPDWFPLVQGKRLKSSLPDSHSVQLCTSHPEVVEKLARGITGVLDADPTIEIVSLAPNDGGGWCECERCRAMDGPSDRSWFARLSNRLAVLNHEVARRVARRHPAVLIKVGAYTFYLLPPTIPGYKPASNLLFQIAHCYCCHNHAILGSGCVAGRTYRTRGDFMPNEQFAEVVRQWRLVSGNLFVYEYYALAAWGRAKMLWPMVHTMRHDIPWYRDQGVKGFFTQYVQMPWTRGPLNHYIAAKLAWNADLDVDWLIDDFSGKFFLEAAAPMKNYLVGIEEAFVRSDLCLSTAFNAEQPPIALGAKIFDRPTRDRLRAELDEARRRASSDVVRRRIAAIRGAFDECDRQLSPKTR